MLTTVDPRDEQLQPHERAHKYSNLLLRLASYCGRYNGASDDSSSSGKSSAKHRYDVTGALELIEGMHSASGVSSFSSCMVYRVEPAASSFAQPNDDLQVSFELESSCDIFKCILSRIDLLHNAEYMLKIQF